MGGDAFGLTQLTQDGLPQARGATDPAQPNVPGVEDIALDAQDLAGEAMMKRTSPGERRQFSVEKA